MELITCKPRAAGTSRHRRRRPMLAADGDPWDGWRGAHCSDAGGGLVRPRHHRPTRTAYDAAMDARALEEAQEKRKDRLDDWVRRGAV
ncbi:hypothetical protein FJT64_027161 [Amphibalanus amphitrite]|uniref:Uncharacterized protein n=1 Tax=Amphibalanus amphitrite TaxID=1232801 RepID=A0A6A4VZG8_AMPAM|nr:hypothetical protein FJT64_027161 [Amphibalanus amphitrite]